MFRQALRIVLLCGLASGLTTRATPQGEIARSSSPTVSTQLSSSSPESQGVNPDELAAAFRHAGSLRPLLSLLILKNNVLIGEEYFHGAIRDSAYNIKSVSKSILSALTGVALKEGFIKSLDEPVSTFFPEYFRPLNQGQIGWAGLRHATDRESRKVTIRHLLTHTSGWIWDENQLLFSAWLWSTDYLRFFFELPIFGKVGERFVYNTGGTHALSALLARASGMTTREFAERYLLGPAGMEVRRWDRAPEGTYIGGAEMHFTARDMAKFGLLYLNHGRLWDRQILTEEWVRESTAERVKASYGTRKDVEVPESWIWSYLQPGHFTGYGYLWWRRDSAGYETYVALGYGGQFIFVIPELKAVLVAASAWDRETNPNRMSHYQAFFEVVDKEIIPAIKVSK
jgi:CubicO group peptidase (beta-lactamase class C family)